MLLFKLNPFGYHYLKRATQGGKHTPTELPRNE